MTNLKQIQVMQSEWIIIKESKIHNKGVFAAKDIPKGTKVIEYIGKKITKLESDDIYQRDLEFSKSNPDVQGGVYIFELNKEYDIDGNVPENVARLINHSCSPNCETDVINGKIWIIASRDIKEGEEINYDYGFGLEDWENHKCKCGEKSCFGYIVDSDLRIRLRKKLARQRAKEKREKQKGK